MNDPTTTESSACGASSLNDLLAINAKKPGNRCVIRLRTTAWTDSKGLNIKTALTFMRKQCDGFNILEEDSSMIGAEQVLTRIVNLGECADGLYEVVTCNERRDWESGHIDDYDYRLVPLSANSN